MSELLILKPALADDTEQRRSKERSLSEVPLKIRQGPAQIDQPKPSGVGGSYRSGRDCIGGALVPHRMGSRR